MWMQLECGSHPGGDWLHQAKGNTKAPWSPGISGHDKQTAITTAVIDTCDTDISTSHQDTRPPRSIFWNRYYLSDLCLPSSLLTEGILHPHIPSAKILHFMYPRKLSFTTAMDCIVSHGKVLTCSVIPGGGSSGSWVGSAEVMAVGLREGSVRG